MSFFRSLKIWKSQGERSGLYGGCLSVSQPPLWSLSLTRLAVWERVLSCKRKIPSDSIPGRFDFMAHRSTLSHQETNHNSLFFFGCLYLQCWTNALYTTLTSSAVKKQLCGPVRFHCACLLPYRRQCRYITTVLPAFARNVFYGGCSVFIWLPLIQLDVRTVELCARIITTLFYGLRTKSVPTGNIIVDMLVIIPRGSSVFSSHT